MKRKGYLMQQIVSLDNLYSAFYKAKRGKQYKKEVIAFAERFDENLEDLRQSLLLGTTIVGEYRYFTIHDPKERVICAAPFRERILQHAIMNNYKLSGRSKRRFRSKIMSYNKMLDEGKWEQEQYKEHILPLLAFSLHAVSKDFRKSCLSLYRWQS